VAFKLISCFCRFINLRLSKRKSFYASFNTCFGYNLPKKTIFPAEETYSNSIGSWIIVILPMVFYISTDKASLARIQGTSIFASQTELLKADSANLKEMK